MTASRPRSTSASGWISIVSALAGATDEPDATYATRYALTYAELERRLRQEPGVRAVTFGDRLPGMEVDVRAAQVETSPQAAPVLIPNLWSAAIGARYFDAFGVRIVAGRDFHDGDRVADAPAVIVNEAFVRRFLAGRDPIGARVRYRRRESRGRARHVQRGRGAALDGDRRRGWRHRHDADRSRRSALLVPRDDAGGRPDARARRPHRR